MTAVLAYTYDADTHCPPCAIARYGLEPGRSWPRDDARDSEGNPVGAIFDFDEWCEPSEPGTHTLLCGTCHGAITTCRHECTDDDDAPADCSCDSCTAKGAD